LSSFKKLALSVAVASSLLNADTTTELENKSKNSLFEISTHYSYFNMSEKLKTENHSSYALRFSLLNNTEYLRIIRSINFQTETSSLVKFSDITANNEFIESYFLRNSLNLHFSHDLVETKMFKPYFILGAGHENIISPHNEIEDSMFFDYGLGLGIDIYDKLSLKFEVKDLIRTSSVPESNLHELVYSIGLGFSFYDVDTKDMGDADEDGILNFQDKCPNTPKGVIPDLNGCPKDSDGDGVIDNEDKCPTTSIGVEVDAIGCEIIVDSDEDGVSDSKDQCDNTPLGTQVDEFGCPNDADGDGILDSVDKCLNTPRGVAIDETGCSFDTDGDGILNKKDQCPDTPANLRVNEFGCPYPDDSDGDGVLNINDQCPRTKKGESVDETGCGVAPDLDNDGMPDSYDKCPFSPSGIKVDELGCASDSDYDSVPDFADECENSNPKYKILDNGCYNDDDKDGTPNEIDTCPATPSNYKVTKDGCPISVDLKVQFKNLSSEIDSKYLQAIEEFASFLKRNKDYNAEIQGYTDSAGSPTFNQKVSEIRAKAVYNYLVDLGISTSRLSYRGYGETNFIATNETVEGRNKNRRVEAKLLKK
jgi:outer membrane protein OmpA-like peptidoglycan-associated protein